MCDQGTSGAHGQHLLRCRTFPSQLRAEGPRLFLTAPLSSVPVGFPSGPRERLWRCGILAISSTTTSDTWSARSLSEGTIGIHWDKSGRNATRLCAHPWRCQGVMA
jgi:hypothetical protein